MQNTTKPGNCSTLRNYPEINQYFSGTNMKLLTTPSGHCLIGMSFFLNLKQLGGPGQGGNAAWMTVLVQKDSANLQLAQITEITELWQIPSEIADVFFYGLAFIFPEGQSWSALRHWGGPKVQVAKITASETSSGGYNIVLFNQNTGKPGHSWSISPKWDTPPSSIMSYTSAGQFTGLDGHWGTTENWGEAWLYAYLPPPNKSGSWDPTQDIYTLHDTFDPASPNARYFQLYESMDIKVMHKAVTDSGFAIYPVVTPGYWNNPKLSNDQLPSNTINLNNN